MGEDSSPAAKTGTQDFSEDLLPREDIFFYIVKWHLSRQFLTVKTAFPGQCSLRKNFFSPVIGD